MNWDSKKKMERCKTKKNYKLILKGFKGHVSDYIYSIGFLFK